MTAVVDRRPIRPFDDAREHLSAELDLLQLRLRREIARLRAARQLTEDDFRGLYVSDAQVDALLADDPGHREAIETLDDQIAHTREDIDARCATTDAGKLPLARLARAFDLDALALDAVVAAAAVDVDLRFGTLFSYAQNDVTRKRPSIDLVLRLLLDDERGRAAAGPLLGPCSPLVERRILRLVEDPHDHAAPLPSRALRLDEALVAMLLGVDRLDEWLAGRGTLTTECRDAADLVLADEVWARLAPLLNGESPAGVVILHGPPGAGRRRIAEALCAASNRSLLTVDCAAIVRQHDPPEAFAVLARDAVVRGAAVLLRRFDDARGVEQDRIAQLTGALEQLAGSVPMLAIETESGWHPEYGWRGPEPLTIDVPPPPLGLRAGVWLQLLHGRATGVDVGALASTFTLTPGRIAAAIRAAEHASRVRGSVLDTDALAEAIRTTSTEGLRRLAERVPPVYAPDDIVLPARASSQLDEICRSYRHRETVYGRWGFRRARPTGAGLKVLFAGPSGTGKSMASQIVASELGLDLYRVDIAAIVDKYIGETEKHLRALFGEAKRVNAAILFDEADALFGKRSSVQDAHDRYANIEVGFLLQQMEDFDGVAILATNLRANMDDAFLRRLDALVDFPAPDAAHRERIWRKMIPPGAPIDGDVDFSFLAERFDLSGGNIRNCALAAAFTAADENRPIRMSHLVVAVANEYQKIGKLPSRSDFGDHFDLLRERR